MLKINKSKMNTNREEVSFYFQDQSLGTGPQNIPRSDVDLPPEYPSFYWATHPGLIEISILDWTIDAAYAELFDLAQGHRWDDLVTTTFLIRYIQKYIAEFSIVAEEDWTVNDVQVGKKDKDISPLNLCKLVEVKRQPPQNPAAQAQPARTCLFYSLISIYRKSIVREGKSEVFSREQVLKLNKHFKNKTGETIKTYQDKFSEFENNESLTLNYKRVICIIDMLYNRYPKARMAHLRISTIPCRFRGCLVINLMGSISSYMGISNSELFMFIFNRSVVEQLSRVAKKGEGVGENRGYFPYHLELSTCTRTAYSLTANPCLALWLHTLGCFFGIERCLKAAVGNFCNVDNIQNSAIVVALNYKNNLDSGMQIVPDDATRLLNDRLLGNTDETNQVKNIAGIVDPVQRARSVYKIASDICKKLQSNNGLTYEERKTVHQKALTWKQYAEGTMGRYFHKMYQAPPPIPEDHRGNASVLSDLEEEILPDEEE